MTHPFLAVFVKQLKPSCNMQLGFFAGRTARHGAMYRSAPLQFNKVQFDYFLIYRSLLPLQTRLFVIIFQFIQDN